MKLEIIVPIILMLTAIFFNKMKKWPSGGNWIYEYEDDKGIKILTIVVRIFLFSIGIASLIYLLYFDK